MIEYRYRSWGNYVETVHRGMRIIARCYGENHATIFDKHLDVLCHIGHVANKKVRKLFNKGLESRT